MLLSNINNWSPRILVVDKTSDFSMSTLDMGLNPSTHKVFVPDHPAEGVTIENKKNKRRIRFLPVSTLYSRFVEEVSGTRNMS